MPKTQIKLKHIQAEYLPSQKLNSLQNHSRINRYHITQQNSQLQLQARDLIKIHKHLKQLKPSHKNQRKQRRLYERLIDLIWRVFGEKFRKDTADELMDVVNRLIFLFEGVQNEADIEMSNKKDKQNANETLLAFDNKSEIYNMTESLSTKLESDLAKVSDFEYKTKPGLKVFIYEELKRQYSQIKKQKQKMNNDILLVNKKIKEAGQMLEQKMRNFDLCHIIEINALKNEHREDINQILKCKSSPLQSNKFVKILANQNKQNTLLSPRCKVQL